MLRAHLEIRRSTSVHRKKWNSAVASETVTGYLHNLRSCFYYFACECVSVCVCVCVCVLCVCVCVLCMCVCVLVYMCVCVCVCVCVCTCVCEIILVACMSLFVWLVVFFEDKDFRIVWSKKSCELKCASCLITDPVKQEPRQFAPYKEVQLVLRN